MKPFPPQRDREPNGYFNSKILKLKDTKCWHLILSLNFPLYILALEVQIVSAHSHPKKCEKTPKFSSSLKQWKKIKQ